jgi:hypothetical protein
MARVSFRCSCANAFWKIKHVQIIQYNLDETVIIHSFKMGFIDRHMIKTDMRNGGEIPIILGREWSVKMTSHKLKCLLLLLTNTDNTAVTTVTFRDSKRSNWELSKDLEVNLETVPRNIH